MIRWRLEEIFASERQIFYTNKTIPRHIDYLADAFLISKASGWDFLKLSGLEKRLEKRLPAAASAGTKNLCYTEE